MYNWPNLQHFYHYPGLFYHNTIPTNQQNINKTIKVQTKIQDAHQPSSLHLSNQIFPIAISRKVAKVKSKVKTKKNAIHSKNAEYRPQTQRKNKKKVSYKNSKRNLISNSIHQIFSFALNKSRSFSLAEKLLQRSRFNNIFSIHRFYLYTKIIRDKLRNYLNEESLCIIAHYHDPLCEFYKFQQQDFYLEMIRTLMLRFLKFESTSLILTSRRMCNENRTFHIKIRRHLIEMLKLYSVKK